MPPAFANGKICYLEIPAIDIARSAAFYQKSFGWKIRQRGDGARTTTRVGARRAHFHHGRQRSRHRRRGRRQRGGEIVQPLGALAPEITARFRDPAGNVFGLYQQPG
jgi:predicted enzyme related to lactoylglutathione lyase